MGGGVDWEMIWGNFLSEWWNVLIDKGCNSEYTAFVKIYVYIYDLSFSLYANYILNFLPWVFWVIKFFTNLYAKDKLLR